MTALYEVDNSISMGIMHASISTKIHATSKFLYLMTRDFPWNSIIWNNMELLVSNWCTLSSMESQWIPWNCSCHRNWRTPSSMEFQGSGHVIEIGPLQFPEILFSWIWSCFPNWPTPSSMEFHGTANVIKIGTLRYPWNSMEPLVSSKLAH